MELLTDLPLAAQTNFAELVEQAQASLLQRSVADVPGSFNRKEVRGSTYWYWQWRDLQGVLRQVYLGPDDDRLRRLIEQRQQGKPRVDKSVGGLVRACVSLGCMASLPQHGKIISRLDEHGFFRAGGVLIGTHAFIAMSNMLGVRWRQGFRTNDIDFAHAGRNVSLALPTNLQVDVHDAISSLEMGLLPPKSITAGPAATYLTAKGDMRVDLLTVAGRSDKVFRHEELGVNLQPLKFMEFALEQTTQTVLISGEDAIVVNIPSPMRYAMHKLLVMAEREEAFRSKLGKDAGQVAALVTYGIERAPGALEDAAHDMLARGRGWRSRLVEGLRVLASFQPEAAGSLASVLGLTRRAIPGLPRNPSPEA